MSIYTYYVYSHIHAVLICRVYHDISVSHGSSVRIPHKLPWDFTFEKQSYPLPQDRQHVPVMRAPILWFANGNPVSTVSKSWRYSDVSGLSARLCKGISLCVARLTTSLRLSKTWSSLLNTRCLSHKIVGGGPEVRYPSWDFYLQPSSTGAMIWQYHLGSNYRSTAWSTISFALPISLVPNISENGVLVILWNWGFSSRFSGKRK